MRRFSSLSAALGPAFFLAALLTLAAPLPSARAAFGEAPPADALHPSTDTVKHDLTTVIESQLAAFRADDYATAYTFAATEIRGMFGLPEFESMVKKGYPIIAHSSAAEFGLAFDTGDEAVVNVRIETAEKQGVQYQYVLKKEAKGWKINGVSELKPAGPSV